MKLKENQINFEVTYKGHYNYLAMFHEHFDGDESDWIPKAHIKHGSLLM